MARAVRHPPKFKRGDRVEYVPNRSTGRYRKTIGTVYAQHSWGMKNGKNYDDGLVAYYSVVWDAHAHKEDAHNTSVPEPNLKPLPAVERLAEIINVPPTYTA